MPLPFVLLTTNALPIELLMETTPGYVGNRLEMETIARHGDQAAFFAIYGHPDATMIVLNGVFFRQQSHVDAFIPVQDTRSRAIRAYTLTTDSGVWLLLIARNPKPKLTAGQIKQFEQGFKRYARRLGLTSRRDSFFTGHAR